jgi:ferredoxin
MARAPRVRVDRTVCVGNAMCTTIAPGVFALNDDRQSEAVNPTGDTGEKILEAAENCPVSHRGGGCGDGGAAVPHHARARMVPRPGARVERHAGVKLSGGASLRG